MIRINLAKTSNYSSAGTQTGISIGAASMGSTQEQVPKIAAMIVFLILVIGYEQYTLGQKQDRLVAVEKEYEVLQTEVNKFGSVRTVVEGLLKERNKLNEKLKVIQKISQKRAFKIRAVGKIQEILPDDLWLKEMVVDKNTVALSGYSRTPTSVQKIVRQLNNYEFIDSAITQELKRVKIEKEDVQAFDIEIKVTE